MAAEVSAVLERHSEVYPSTARDVGRRDFDAVFPGYFRPAPDEIAEMRRRLAPLESVADPDLRADVRTAQAWVERESFRVEVRGRRHIGPSECLAEASVWGYVKQPYASVADKIAVIEKHLRGVPDFLAGAADTLEAELPAGERMRSIQFGLALAADLRDIELLLAAEHPGATAPQLAEPAEAAAAACEEFASRVETCVPRPAVMGPDLLAEWIRVAEGIDITAAETVAAAQAEVDELTASLDALAAGLGVERRSALYDLMDYPASTETALDALERIIGRLREFWAACDVVSLDAANPLAYRRRPRMFAAAEFGITGPYEKDGHPHYLYLPQRSDAAEQQSASGRQHFALPMLEILAVHETYAGHYVHAEAAFRATRGIRSQLRLWAGLVEGWAHYTEELAIEQGLADGRPLVHAAQLLSALEAATRLVVYASVHAGRWSFGEAVAQAARLCDWPVDQAAREVLTATSDWRRSLYTLGKLHIREWRRSDGVGATPAELTNFHEGLIGAGFAPLGVARRYQLEKAAALAVSDA